MHPCHHRRNTGGQERARRLHRRHARERPRLARIAARPEAARAIGRAGAGRRRWRALLLEGARRGVAQDPRAALLGAQDRQRPGSAGDLDGGDEGRRRNRIRRVHRELPDQVPQGGRVPEEGPRGVARLLRLPCRALEAPQDDEPIESTFATAPSAPRDASRTRPRSPWCSSWSRAHKRAGAASTATTTCQGSSRV